MNKTLATLLVLTLVPPLPAQRYSPSVGQLHPEFTLPDIRTGKPISLSAYRGKKVLLIQFASW